MEKIYTLKLTETEMRNPQIKKRIVEVVALRLKTRKHDKFIKISNMEYEIIKKHWSWVDVEIYEPDKKKQFKNEVGKYNGKRVVLIGK